MRDCNDNVINPGFICSYKSTQCAFRWEASSMKRKVEPLRWILKTTSGFLVLTALSCTAAKPDRPQSGQPTRGRWSHNSAARSAPGPLDARGEPLEEHQLVDGDGDLAGLQEALVEQAERVELARQLDGAGVVLWPAFRPHMLIQDEICRGVWHWRVEGKKVPPNLTMRFEQFSFGDFCRFRSKSFFLSLVGGWGCQRCSLTVLRIFNSFWDGLYQKWP